MKWINGGASGLIKQLKTQGVDVLAEGLSYDDIHALFAQSDVLSCQHVQVSNAGWSLAVDRVFQALSCNMGDANVRSQAHSWLVLIRAQSIGLDLFSRVADRVSAKLGGEDSVVIGKQELALTDVAELLVVMGAEKIDTSFGIKKRRWFKLLFAAANVGSSARSG